MITKNYQLAEHGEGIIIELYLLIFVKIVYNKLLLSCPEPYLLFPDSGAGWPRFP